MPERVFFFMKRETISAIKDLAYYSSIGLSVALSIFIGLAIGVYLDRKVFNTTPWFTMICLGLGIAAGFRPDSTPAQAETGFHSLDGLIS